MVPRKFADPDDRDPENEEENQDFEGMEGEDEELGMLVEPDADDLDALDEDDDELDDLEDGDLLDEEAFLADSDGDAEHQDDFDKEDDENVNCSPSFSMHRTFPRKRSGPDRERPLTWRRTQNDYGASAKQPSDAGRGRDSKSQ